MKTLLASCFGQTDPDYREYLQQIVDSQNTYYHTDKLTLFEEHELEFIDSLIQDFDTSSQMASMSMFCTRFSQVTVNDFTGVPVLALSDMRVKVSNLINSRLQRAISKEMTDISIKIRDQGITEQIADRMSKLQRLSASAHIRTSVNINLDPRSIYAEKLKKPAGMQFGIKALDDRIGGMDEGTITTIAGFTSHYKSTLALNIAHLNAYRRGFNIAYLTLETPKEDFFWNLLSLHSYEPHLNKFPFVSHDRMRKCLMTQDEADFVFDEVYPDLINPYMGQDGQLHERGKIVFLDETDFETFSFTEIAQVLENVDEQLGGQLDAVIVDYIQLCKFTSNIMGSDDNKMINSYVTFFRRICQNFNSCGKKKKLIGVLLSQINRENWKRARNNEGRYDITCLADANELERGSHRVVTTYTNEDMKGRKAAQVQILKNRNGQTLYEPESVYADGEIYLFGDESGMDSTFGGDMSFTVASAMDSLDFGDLSALGL